MVSAAANKPARVSATAAGILWMIVTGICFVLVAVTVRLSGSDLPAIEAAFIRYLIGIVIMIPVFVRIAHFRPSAGLMGRFAARGIVHGIAVILWFYAMARIPIAEVTAIGYTAPIFVTIGAAIFLGERLQLRRVGGVLVGFVGALVILRPGFQELSQGQLAQLAAGPLFAASFIMAKKLTREAGNDEIVAMLSLFCTLVLLPGALWNWQTPTVVEVAWLGATAVFATVGHYTMIQALRAAPITVTQPFTFLQLVWAAILGLWIFADPLDPYVFLGSGIIVAAATYISHREAVAAREPITPPGGATKS